VSPRDRIAPNGKEAHYRHVSPSDRMKATGMNVIDGVHA